MSSNALDEEEELATRAIRNAPPFLETTSKNDSEELHHGSSAPPEAPSRDKVSSLEPWGDSSPSTATAIISKKQSVRDICVCSSVFCILMVGMIVALWAESRYNLYERHGSSHSPPSSCSSDNCQWVLLSNNGTNHTALRGDRIQDQFGSAVALSGDGHRLAVAARVSHYMHPDDKANNPNRTMGYVRVYQDDDDDDEAETPMSCSWLLLTPPQPRIMEHHALGGVSMSDDGRRIAFLTDPNKTDYYFEAARPAILEHNGSHWNVVGLQNPQMRVMDQQQSVVRLSPDGNHLATRYYERVTVFRAPFGEEPQASLTKLGETLACSSLPSFSYNGDRILCIKRETNGESHVATIFDWTEDSETWLVTSQRPFWDGKPCSPLTELFYCGSVGYNAHSIGPSVSYDGKRFAVLYWGNCVHATCTDSNGTRFEDSFITHRTLAFDDDDEGNSVWKSSSSCPNRMEYGFISLAISGDGHRLAVGDHIAYNYTGAVQVFEADSSGCWRAIGSELRGVVPQGSFGFDVSLSKDGTRLAVGAPHYYACAEHDSCAPGEAYVYGLRRK
uniref:Uncharacterized protein n=1 Tax=Amphora coffeiformis TaxID=265554 RepID=A0A7S3L509_9STRA|mmetsp:Transcript_8375/g.15965  ORF Transcript_8375/g.15965 Transcript_8375/m.15965 type:complete len:559 (+) Transcript_8375:491-2167(+)